MLVVDHGPMLKAGFGGNAFGGLRQLPIAQRPAQITREIFLIRGIP